MAWPENAEPKMRRELASSEARQRNGPNVTDVPLSRRSRATQPKMSQKTNSVGKVSKARRQGEQVRFCILRPSHLGHFGFPFQPVARKKRSRSKHLPIISEIKYCKSIVYVYLSISNLFACHRASFFSSRFCDVTSRLGG